MPNRILKESICSSESINSLSWFEEVVFYRLIVICDDFGRFDARPAILRSRLFPLKSVTDKQIERALESLRTADMVCLYEVDGKPFLQLRTWEQHQQRRAKFSKYPAPPAFDSICYQMRANVPEESRNRETRNEDTRNEESNICAEFGDADSPQEPPVITLPLNDGTEHEVYTADVLEWTALYPAVNIDQELRNMRGWLLANAKKRKTRDGVKRFINSWLAKAQNNGGRQSAQTPARSAQPGHRKSFAELAAEAQAGGAFNDV